MDWSFPIIPPGFSRAGLWLSSRRRWVLWGVVASVLAYGLSDFIEILSGWAKLNEKERMDGVAGFLFTLGLAWLIYKRPAKWGFRLGLLLTAGILLGVGLMLLLSFAPQSELKDEMFGQLTAKGVGEWIASAASALFLFGLTFACLLLRWLYPEPKRAVAPPAPFDEQGVAVDAAR